MATTEVGMAIELGQNKWIFVIGFKIDVCIQFGIQIPVALTLLSRAGLVNSNDVRREENGSLVISTLLFLLLWFNKSNRFWCLIILFEISILLAKFLRIKKGVNSYSSNKNIGETDYNRI